MKILKLLLNFFIAILLITIIPFSGISIPLFLILSVALLTSLSVKFGWIYSLFSAAFAGVITYLFTTSVIAAVIFPVLVLVSSLGIYIALRLKADIKVTLLAGTAGYFALIILAYLIYGGGFIADIINMTKSVLFESLDSISASVPTGSKTAVGEVKQVYEMYFENLKVVAPSIILSLFFLLSYFSIKVSSHLVKDKTTFETIPPFSELHAPAFLLIVCIIAYFGQTIGNTFISGLMANLFMALSVYYTLCGFSLIDFFTKTRIKPLAARITIYVSGVVLLSIVSVMIYFVNPVLIAMFGGAIDSVVNYRAKIRMLKRK